VSLRTSVVIQLLTSFKNMYVEESVILDCHGANASRNLIHPHEIDCAG